MKKKSRVLAGMLAVVTALSGCAGTENIFQSGTESSTENRKESIIAGAVDNQPVTNMGNMPIEDNFSLYENWDYGEVTTMYLTVRSGNEADGTNHTWEEVNTYSAYYYEDMGIERYKVEGLLQVGDENGPVEGELGYGQYVPNSIVQIRGQTSTMREQKNYRISIRDEKGDWEGQTTINLNKHVGDSVRFINMLCYHLMTQIDGMMSARTKFVHLYVKDETESGQNAGFEDYGLYTYVEQINKTYLRNHNLDKNGQLYKINFFEFYPYEDVIMLKSDAEYDVAEFEQYMEIKGNDDHSKLMEMLQELNDYSKPIEEVFEKWFDEENYFSWLAFHILVGNIDTNARNFFLYSPTNINKFYFISWDNDIALREKTLEYTRWQDGMAHEEGISNYWGNILHRRVMQSAAYREKLHEKILEMKEFLSEEKIREEAEFFSSIVKPYVYRMPDAEHAPLTGQQYDEVVKSIPTEIESNYQRYLQSLEKPMPFYLGDPDVSDNKLKFVWDAAYDFDQETISYTLEISEDYLFTDTVYREENLLVPEAEAEMLPPGQYFYRIIARNTSGYEQMAFDYYSSTRGKEYGMKCFWITQDGKVEVETYEE